MQSSDPHGSQYVFCISTNERTEHMKKMLYKLMAVCVLAMPVAAGAQSNDNMKQDQSQQDQMKQRYEPGSD
jgi:hypothetical protein